MGLDTMLTHVCSLLSRAHSNYLAQINIRMNERQEKTSDILGKLTVLGTIVLPMNVVTGIWGMNCKLIHLPRGHCFNALLRSRPWTGHRELNLVLVHNRRPSWLRSIVFPHCEESVWYCLTEKGCWKGFLYT